MPNSYAHYRFGAAAIPDLPEEAQRVIRQYRRFYDVGLHGPDIFFFYRPLFKNSVSELGHRLHMQTGQVFFCRLGRILRLAPSDPGLAYLLGVLGHYALDSACHPAINSLHSRKLADHSALESEFDRYLLALDGKPPEFAQNVKKHLALTGAECGILADFYVPVTAGKIHACLRSMSVCSSLLASPAGIVRTVMETGIARVRPDCRGLMIPLNTDTACAPYVPMLEKQYQAALAHFPALAGQLLDHLRRGQPLGSDFAPAFG